MSHVVMQAAEFETEKAAIAAERELRQLFEAYAEFEAKDPSAFDAKKLQAPLVAFGARHGVEWPADEEARFLVKGAFAEEAQLLRVDRMLFFWAGGFELGGKTLRRVLEKLGATGTADFCHLLVRCKNPEGRAAELTTFLDEEDFADQYHVDDGDDEASDALFSLILEGPGARMKRLWFDDSGVQDWAFTAILPQLSDEDPSLVEDDASDDDDE